MYLHSFVERDLIISGARFLGGYQGNFCDIVIVDLLILGCEALKNYQYCS